ncbi:MAG: flagellar motor switch protein FliG [Thermoanaerobacteraceae bacterium]|uniref:Flagellar motor switch protein FliG n=1 Tax=Biomaibacter acetigenes TaxID=2316383 RepID=A0A3G2R9X0_9FIRM|nr:flagellar motor switch protein FliG [Biomaibacter acetigenes]AYO32236.1 flagellar motor switch protein FliG [Biomaibacter acetigenes]MDK2877471.1 flagellar motor switch protein FliG [Thermoanaerobacteraceae bacterium]MDN5312983.1 flagellar motor switch protein FliG [Thermoanaerobacteraceae bacterium]RKL62963.1 flagellar motor switch protein FliG [Thermoanaerobacteraceae bacterium SP2]
MPLTKFTGKQKAAILMVSLGPEIAANIYRFLKEEEIEQLTLEIANLKKISNEDKNAIAEEFYQMLVAQNYITEGGIDYARDILEKALGTQKALEIINRLTSSLQVRPFDFIRKADPVQLMNFLQNENSQTIALIMTYLNPEQSASLLSSLPPEKQVDIARRVATMDRTSPDVILEVEKVLERQLASVVNEDYTNVGGIQAVVNILNNVDRGTEKNIIEALEMDNPDLAEEIRRRMFVFEDILTLDNRSVQRTLREVDNQDLTMALKGASEEVKKKIFSNMSKRQAEMVNEDMQYMGPVRLRDVEEAQQKIVNIIRKLEDAGEIIISRGGGDEIIV